MVTLDSLEFYFGGGGNIPTSQATGEVRGYYGSGSYCVDCRLRGSSEKPDFWPSN
jgi:hypothetical protein